MTAMDSSPENARLKAIMTLLCHQGLRQYEVVGLKRKHIDLNKGLAWVLGKGEDEREKIHLHPRTVEALEEYLNQYEVTNGNPLFFSISRAATDNTQPLTERGLRKTVTKFFRELGIESTVHGTRHWFTTRNIKAFKGDLTKVQKLTRHKSLATLEVYNDAVQTKADLDIYVQAFQDVRL
jgi:integrase